MQIRIIVLKQRQQLQQQEVKLLFQFRQVQIKVGGKTYDAALSDAAGIVGTCVDMPNAEWGERYLIKAIAIAFV